jgi:hypothetical protein
MIDWLLFLRTFLVSKYNKKRISFSSLTSSDNHHLIAFAHISFCFCFLIQNHRLTWKVKIPRTTRHETVKTSQYRHLMHFFVAFRLRNQLSALFFMWRQCHKVSRGPELPQRELSIVKQTKIGEPEPFYVYILFSLVSL